VEQLSGIAAYLSALVTPAVPPTGTPVLVDRTLSDRLRSTPAVAQHTLRPPVGFRWLRTGSRAKRLARGSGRLSPLLAAQEETRCVDLDFSRRTSLCPSRSRLKRVFPSSSEPTFTMSSTS